MSHASAIPKYSLPVDPESPILQRCHSLEIQNLEIFVPLINAFSPNSQSTTLFPLLSHPIPSAKNLATLNVCFLKNPKCRNALRNGETNLKNRNCFNLEIQFESTQWSKVLKFKTKRLKVFSIGEVWWTLWEAGGFVSCRGDSRIIWESWPPWILNIKNLISFSRRLRPFNYMQSVILNCLVATISIIISYQ